MFGLIKKRYVIYIENVLAVSLLLFGLYSIGPWYVEKAGASFVAAFSLLIYREIVAACYVTASVLTLIGNIKDYKKIKSVGMFMISCCFLFSALLRIALFGFFPVFWWFLLALAAIAGILYIVEKDG